MIIVAKIIEYIINKNIKLRILPMPVIAFVANVKTTTATAIPFGMFNVMYTFSLNVYNTFLNDNCTEINLSIRYAPNKIVEGIKKLAVQGIFITEPIKTKTSISNTSENISQNS